MKRQFFLRALAAIACGAVLLTSCTTPETRITEHPEIYNRLAPSDRELVARGEIRPGLAQDAVFLAWGAPEQRTVANVHGRPAETWVYFSSTATGDYGYGGFYGPYSRGFYSPFGGRFYGRRGHRYYGFGYGYYDPFPFGGTQIVRYPYKTISFQNRRVVAFQFLAPPTVYY